MALEISVTWVPSNAQKLRQEHCFNVPCDLFYGVMCDVVPEGLEEQRIGAGKKKKKRPLTSKRQTLFNPDDATDR